MTPFRQPAGDDLLASCTTASFAALRASAKSLVALVAVGSVEPHGPHLPLGTDTIISASAAHRAVAKLREAGVTALVAPAFPYGVTDFAEGFAGAVSLPAPPLTAALEALVASLLRAGFDHVCLVNNHLEPAHDAAVRASIATAAAGTASVACPLTRRWARTLSAEFKSGACHAGRYETSIVLAASEATVDATKASALPSNAISLSDGIRAGKSTFKAMGMDDAYAGAPAEATAAEGHEQLDLLATMIATEVVEALGKRESAG